MRVPRSIPCARAARSSRLILCIAFRRRPSSAVCVRIFTHCEAHCARVHAPIVSGGSHACVHVQLGQPLLTLRLRGGEEAELHMLIFFCVH